MSQNSPDPGARVIDALSEITGALVDGHTDTGAALFRMATLGVELLSAAAVGIMVVDPRGGFGVVAASDERARLVELLQTQTESGPCPQCIRTGDVLAVPDLTVDPDRWPEFAAVPTSDTGRCSPFRWSSTAASSAASMSSTASPPTSTRVITGSPLCSPP